MLCFSFDTTENGRLTDRPDKDQDPGPAHPPFGRSPWGRWFLHKPGTYKVCTIYYSDLVLGYLRVNCYSWLGPTNFLINELSFLHSACEHVCVCVCAVETFWIYVVITEFRIFFFCAVHLCLSPSSGPSNPASAPPLTVAGRLWSCPFRWVA